MTRFSLSKLPLSKFLLIALCLLPMGAKGVLAAGPYNGTAVGTPTFVTAATNFGQAVTLNGTSQYISVPEPGPLSINTGSAYTLEARFKTTSASGVQVIIGHDPGLYIGLSSGLAVFTVGGLSPATTTGSATLSDGAWHTLCAVLRAGSGGATYYVDGVSIGSATGTNNGFGGSTCYIGGWTSAANYFNGTIDEVSISNVAQYSANYTPVASPFSAARAGQTALYHLDGNALDSNTTGNAATATAFALSGPATGTTGTASALFTLAPNGSLSAAETVTLSDGGAGGTFSTGTSLSFGIGTSAGQTFTYTAATSAAITITATASPSLGTAPTASYTSSANAVTIGTLSSASTASSITLSLSAAVAGGTGAGYNYKVWRDTQPNVSVAAAVFATPTSFPYSDTSATAGVDYYYKVEGFDGAASMAASFPASLTGATGPLSVYGRLSSQTLGVVFEGDSITYGAQAGPGVGPTASAKAELQTRGGLRAVSVYDKGSSGTSTTEWQPGGSNFLGSGSPIAANNSAAYQFTQANPTGLLVFSIMLGTNDSAVSGYGNGNKTKAAYKAALKAIVDQHLSDWASCKVVLHYPTYYTPNAQTSYTYGEAGLVLLQQYQAAESELVTAYAATNPGRVGQGDKLAYADFATNYAADMVAESGGNGMFYLHPSATGNTVLGKYWASAIYNTLYPAAAAVGGTKRRIQ